MHLFHNLQLLLIPVQEVTYLSLVHYYTPTLYILEGVDYIRRENFCL